MGTIALQFSKFTVFGVFWRILRCMYFGFNMTTFGELPILTNLFFVKFFETAFNQLFCHGQNFILRNGT